MSLLLMAVAASLRRVSRWLPSLVLTAISLIFCTAMLLALRKPLIIVWLLTPCSTCSLISFRISPARTTTDVVPSPTSASCDRAMSVRIRAAGWTMSSSFMTVAPSLVIVCLPFSSTSNKSPPYGPGVLFTVDCTATHALMFERICPRPCDWSVPGMH